MVNITFSATESQVRALQALNNVPSVNNIDDYSLGSAAQQFPNAAVVPSISLRERQFASYRRPRLEKKDDASRLLGAMSDQAIDEEQLQDIADRVIRAISQRRDAFGSLRQWDDDPSRQYLALTHALRTAQERGEMPHIIEHLYDAVERMTALRGGAIFAGLNTVVQAKAFGAARPAMDLFRQTYRDAVLGQLGFRDTLTLLLTRFGDDVERGVALLRKALAADLASLRPSRDPERLNAILQDLYQLAVAASMLPRCKTIAERMRCRYPYLQLEGLGLMKDVAQWTAEAWLMAYHVTHLMAKYRFEEEGRRSLGQAVAEDCEEDEEASRYGDRITFLNGLLEILRGLPPKIFLSDEHRLQAVAAVQQVLDGLLLE